MTVSDNEWRELKDALPVGETVHGCVTHHARFGFFLNLEDLPTVNAVVLARDFDRAADDDDSWVEPFGFPTLGSRVEAVVLQHVDSTRQIRLHVDSHMRFSEW